MLPRIASDQHFVIGPLNARAFHAKFVKWRSPTPLRARPRPLTDTSDELDTLFQEEVEKNNRELEAKSQEIDAFYNLPKAEADFAYWSKAAFWTLDEAIALSLGKSPDVVNWSRAENDVTLSKFAKKYQQIGNLVLRAEYAGELNDPVQPSEFVTWTKRCEVDCSPELMDLVKARDDNFQDWKAQYEKLATDFGELESSFREALATRDEEIAFLIKDRDHWQELSQTLQNTLDELKVLKEPANTKILNSLQKIIIGVAVEKYGYDPTRRNDAAKLIVDDLAYHGITIHADTVRKCLREAAEEHPPESTE